ncbi:hypothetical protein CF394_00770 [Tetzosporium hominis]|uniref:Uncharacterized protein n=1 Tax=Tetzosporium hominis TaxID=2020506 RepID=A0A264W7B0_9BACL|nr:hypothetical protein [Tetzosporium hominis]OZS79470.1 hypothetical protein CF394_00770 [Tetzosporium hominis]
MSENKTLNPLVTELIQYKLNCIDESIESNVAYSEKLGAEVQKTKENIDRLREEKYTLMTILKTGDATLVGAIYRESPKEFKVRE